MYLLTGTPLTNRPRDLFVLLQLVGHSLGRSFLAFAKRYCAAEKTEYGWKTDGASNLEELTVQLHGVMLRRSTDGLLTIAVEDDGIGWRGTGVTRGTGLGTRVITAMAGNLQTTVEYEPVPKGTHAVFKFRI